MAGADKPRGKHGGKRKGAGRPLGTTKLGPREVYLDFQTLLHPSLMGPSEDHSEVERPELAPRDEEVFGEQGDALAEFHRIASSLNRDAALEFRQKAAEVNPLAERREVERAVAGLPEEQRDALIFLWQAWQTKKRLLNSRPSRATYRRKNFNWGAREQAFRALKQQYADKGKSVSISTLKRMVRDFERQTSLDDDA